MVFSLFASPSGTATASKSWFGAAQSGNLEEIENGLARGVKVDARSTDHSRTALWLASASGHGSVVTRLIEPTMLRLSRHWSRHDTGCLAAFKATPKLCRSSSRPVQHCTQECQREDARDLTAVSNVSAKTVDAIRHFGGQKRNGMRRRSRRRKPYPKQWPTSRRSVSPGAPRRRTGRHCRACASSRPGGARPRSSSSTLLPCDPQARPKAVAMD